MAHWVALLSQTTALCVQFACSPSVHVAFWNLELECLNLQYAWLSAVLRWLQSVCIILYYIILHYTTHTQLLSQSSDQ